MRMMINIQKIEQFNCLSESNSSACMLGSQKGVESHES